MLCASYGDLKHAEGLFPEPGPATMDELLATHDKAKAGASFATTS